MKKLVSIFLIVVLLSLTLFSSCKPKEEDNAKPNEEKQPTVMEKISDAMDNVASWEMDSVADIEAYYMSSLPAEITETSHQIYAKSDDGKIYYYSTSEGRFSHQGKETEVFLLEAYNEGNYFFKYDAGDKWNNLHSPITQEEFLDYFKSVNDSESIFEEYNNIEITENESKDYVVKLSQYNDEVIEMLNFSFGFPLEENGGTITDVTVTITADADFLIKDMILDFTFSDSMFSGSQTITFKNYNNVTKKVSELKPGYFTSVEGGAVIALLATALFEDAVNSDKGSFSINSISKKRTYGINDNVGQATVMYEANTEVSYGREDEKLYFNAETDTDDKKTETDDKKTVTTYKNNVLDDDGSKSTIKDSEGEDILESLMNPIGYTLLAIKNVKTTVTSDGTVLYYVEVDETDIPLNISGCIVLQVTFAVKDGKLSYIIYSVNPESYYYNGRKPSVHVEIKVTFNEY